ncbi:MAG: mandelate racemase/muconate lactonizing enzyme family protein [Candidatus Latescibacteria bacterium]|nr:mandelate racemase/muconate lactonizing enzyme family protein [Candidatus Latescibacterota bacterium]
MKITDIKTFLVNPGASKNWLFVKVETDEGIHGWGECYTQADRDKSIEIHVQQLARYLKGRDPFDIKHFTFMAYNDYAGKRGAMELYCAISGIEHALWDICGKATGQPVYNLLGGKCRPKIRVYANGWSGGKTPEEIAQRAKAVVDRGFTALKFAPFPSPWRAYITHDIEQHAIDRVAAVREAVGPDVEILVEVHRRLSPDNAIRVARQIERYRPYWYEEPVSARDVDGLAEARQNINIPIVTGEELYTKTEFRPIFEKRAADILNPDVCNCGGILELVQIAAMAEPYHVAMSPHNYNSTTLGLAATLHACATMPNFIITEYFVNFEEKGLEIATPGFKATNSYIELPDTPGLGIDLDEDALAANPYKQMPERGLRHSKDEG